MGFWHAVLPYIEVVLPTAVVALIFWFVMRAVLNADRREREADDAMAKEYDARMKERVAELRASGAVSAGQGPAGRASAAPDAAGSAPAEGGAGARGAQGDERGDAGADAREGSRSNDAEPGTHRDS